MSLSSRHHYLPKFYLNGFTDEDGKFHVFDIESNRLKNKKLFPKQVFFEWDRNTFSIGDEKTDFLESEVYKLIDNKNSKAFQKVATYTRESKIDLTDYFFLHYFITNLFWRIPRTDEQIKELFKNANYKELNFQLINKDTGQVDPSASQELLSIPEFRETYRSTMAAIEFIKWDSKIDMKNWRISYSLNQKAPHICGDNPIVLRDNQNLKLFSSELIFPLTKDKTLFYTKNKIKLKEVPPEYSLKLDIVIMAQSKIMATSTNPDYLLTINQLKNQFDLKKLKEELFEIFE